jgi:hypothetical protein
MVGTALFLPQGIRKDTTPQSRAFRDSLLGTRLPILGVVSFGVMFRIVCIHPFLIE